MMKYGETLMKISIIGSFRKYYENIKELIVLLKKNDIEVMSPKFSVITHSKDDFVIFASDNMDFSPAEIQTETLNRILKSDIVYVYNPNGYVGRTTCYEIGIIRTTSIPLLFLENPKDLPIMVCNTDIMKPPKLIYMLLNDSRFLEASASIAVDKNKVRNEMRLRNIVICGSMAFYAEMLNVSNMLKNWGIPTIIPKEESKEKELLSEEQFYDFKRKVSSQYLSKIRDNSTYAILVLNQEKRGVKNYIGANTLVEISMAFCWGRAIYLLNDFYEPLKEELMAWRVVNLNGNLERLIEDYKMERYSLPDKQVCASEFDGQLELGDIYEYFYPLSR